MSCELSHNKLFTMRSFKKNNGKYDKYHFFYILGITWDNESMIVQDNVNRILLLKFNRPQNKIVTKKVALSSEEKMCFCLTFVF